MCQIQALGRLHIWKGFLAAVMAADMRLFICMDTRVRGKGAALNETFVSILYIAMIRSLPLCVSDNGDQI